MNMKKRNIKLTILISTLSLLTCLLISSTVIYIKNQDKSTKYNIQNNIYSNVEDIESLVNYFDTTLNLEFSKIFLHNSAIIKTDYSGNINELDIDMVYIDEHEKYFLQLQKQRNNDYILIKDDISETDSYKVNLYPMLRSISVWNNYENNYEYEYIFTFHTDSVSNIKRKEEALLFVDGSLNTIDSDLYGTFNYLSIYREMNLINLIYFERNK